MAEQANEFYCHGCDGYITVLLDMALEGNHVITCPECGHEHCRVIKNGEITGDRWDQRNGVSAYTYTGNSTSYSAYSVYNSVGTGDSFTQTAWLNMSTTATSATWTQG